MADAGGVLNAGDLSYQLLVWRAEQRKVAMDAEYRPIRIVHWENENKALREKLETVRNEVHEITEKIESNDAKIKEEWQRGNTVQSWTVEV